MIMYIKKAARLEEGGLRDRNSDRTTRRDRSD